jgi:hypothetical protein
MTTRNLSAEAQRSNFMSEHKMLFKGGGNPVSINGLSATEYGYLLAMLTDNRLQQIIVGEFEKIRDKKEDILTAINNELNKSVLREERNIQKKDAVTNMERLRDNIECICDYVDLCRKLKLKIYPDKNFDEKQDQEVTKKPFIWIGGMVGALVIAFILLKILFM